MWLSRGRGGGHGRLLSQPVRRRRRCRDRLLPVAAVVGAAFAASRRNLAWAGLAAAFAALLLVALADIVSGSETHFIEVGAGRVRRSFFEVVGHRLDATLENFTQGLADPGDLAALAVIATGIWKREIVLAWFEDSPMIKSPALRPPRAAPDRCADQRFGALFIRGRNALSGAGSGICVDDVEYHPESGSRPSESRHLHYPCFYRADRPRHTVFVDPIRAALTGMSVAGGGLRPLRPRYRALRSTDRLSKVLHHCLTEDHRIPRLP